MGEPVRVGGIVQVTYVALSVPHRRAFEMPANFRRTGSHDD
jgi:hypothetical protein